MARERERRMAERAKVDVNKVQKRLERHENREIQTLSHPYFYPLPYVRCISGKGNGFAYNSLALVCCVRFCVLILLFVSCEDLTFSLNLFHSSEYQAVWKNAGAALAFVVRELFFFHWLCFSCKYIHSCAITFATLHTSICRRIESIYYRSTFRNEHATQFSIAFIFRATIINFSSL